MLLVGARLRVGGRRLRALAAGDSAAVERFVQSDSALRLAEARRDARDDAENIREAGARVVAFGDADYPAGLRELADPPAFLVVRGTLPRGGVAVIGSRDAQPRACAFAHDVVRALNVPLVSGLAHGIDAAAHAGALASGLPQVAYVGTGIARTSPPDHAALADAIVAAGGAIATEYLPRAAASSWTLRRRDRLQAAHAHAVLLVTSDVEGGAMHAMAAAFALGRPRFVCNASDVAAGTGNRRVIESAATVVPWDADAAAHLIAATLS
jgi:DNA processing protein